MHTTVNCHLSRALLDITSGPEVRQIFKIRTLRKPDIFLPGIFFVYLHRKMFKNISLANLGVRSCLIRKLICPVWSSPNLDLGQVDLICILGNPKRRSSVCGSHLPACSSNRNDNNPPPMTFFFMVTNVRKTHQFFAFICPSTKILCNFVNCCVL